MNRLENTHRYDDIIDLPHPVSEKEMQHEERMMLGEGISRETYDSE